MDRIHIDPRYSQIAPETYRLLESGELFVHSRVQAVVLGGSRGLPGNYRPDSDIDLSLIVSTGNLPPGHELGSLLLDVLDTTLQHWKGSIELDLAAVFDIQRCHLLCFGQSQYDVSLCGGSGRDCFGIYKTQRGFHGFVPPFGVTVEKMNPTLIIWRRAD